MLFVFSSSLPPDRIHASVAFAAWFVTILPHFRRFHRFHMLAMHPRDLQHLEWCAPARCIRTAVMHLRPPGGERICGGGASAVQEVEIRSSSCPVILIINTRSKWLRVLPFDKSNDGGGILSMFVVLTMRYVHAAGASTASKCSDCQRGTYGSSSGMWRGVGFEGHVTADVGQW